MGIYIQLDCIDCKSSLSFGKAIEQGSSLALRLFSENDGVWHEDVKCWHVLQAFFFKHMNHRLVFRKDTTSEAQFIEAEEEFDDLLKKWTTGDFFT